MQTKKKDRSRLHPVKGAKHFDLGDVLTITTGVLVSRSGAQALYDVLDHVEGREHYTHELVDAANRCKQFIIDQHPQLAAITREHLIGRGKKVFDVIRVQERIFGRRFAIVRMTEPLVTDPHESLMATMYCNSDEAEAV